MLHFLSFIYRDHDSNFESKITLEVITIGNSDVFDLIEQI